MLDYIKLILRIKATVYDDEIKTLIDACKIDLNLAGVNNIDENDNLVKTAIGFYCKWQFGYDDDGYKYKEAYENLKKAMSLSVLYTEVK